MKKMITVYVNYFCKKVPITSIFPNMSMFGTKPLPGLTYFNELRISLFEQFS